MADDSRRVSYVKDGEGWCSKGLLRNYLYVFNFFFLTSGAIVLSVGVWSIVAEHGFVSVLSTISYPLTSYLLVAAGLLVFLATGIGCCGMKRKDRCLLLVYIFFLLLVFLLEAKAGVLAYIYREQAYGELEISLNHTFLDDYGVDEQKTNAIDAMQREFQCCGPNSYADWDKSVWVKSAGKNLVPDSCCKTEIPNCGVRTHPSNIYYTGCIHGLSDTVREHLGYLTIAGLGLCVLQVIGILFSACLYIKLKEPDPASL